MSSAWRKGAECEGVACEHELGQQPLQLLSYLRLKAQPTAADSGSSSDGKGVFTFVLADTVVFKQQKPVKWLFTSKQEPGKVLCKTKKFLTAGRVLQEFIVSKWMPSALANLDEDACILASYVYLDRSSTSGETQLVVEHLDRAALGHLLLYRDKPAHSVLQRFVPTKSGYNHALRSIYTPENCTSQKCISPFLLSDRNASVVQRTATFEIDDPPLRYSDVTDREIQRTIESINIEISAHLGAIVGKQPTRLVSYFKIGADNRIYLMWSSMISFEAGVKTVARDYRLALGNQDATTADTKPKTSDGRENCETKHLLVGPNSQLKVCPKCQRTLPRNEVEYVTTYKSIIRQFECDTTETSPEAPENKIPALIRAISGPIQAERFEQLKSNATYLYQTVQLCLACAQELNANAKPENSPHRQPRSHFKSETPTTKASARRVQRSMTSNELLHLPAKPEETRKPVVVQRRAVSAGAARMGLSKKDKKPSISQFGRHFARFLPRLQTFEPSAPAPAPKSAVMQLALHLKRNCGHPSLRFALSQCNVFPIGSVLPLCALAGICSADLLAQVMQYWAELCQMQSSPANASVVDIDALDGLLAASLKSHKQFNCRGSTDHGQAQRERTERPGLVQGAVSSSCPAIREKPRTPVGAPKRPNRPRSCAPASAASRRARIVSIASIPARENSSCSGRDQTDCKPEATPSPACVPSVMDKDSGPGSIIRVVDGMECLVRASSKSQVDSDGQLALHLEATLRSNGESNNASSTMGLTLTTPQIMKLLPVGAVDLARYLSSQDALLEVLLPRLRIRDGRLLIPELPSTASHRQAHKQQHGQGTALRQSSCLELSDAERRPME